MAIKVYITTVTGNLEVREREKESRFTAPKTLVPFMQVKKQQQRIEMILGNNYKGTEVVYVDVAASEEDKKKMRDLIGNPKALPPQFFNEDTYCGVSWNTTSPYQLTLPSCTHTSRIMKPLMKPSNQRNWRNS